VKATFRPIVWLGPITPWENRRSRWTFKASWQATLDLLDRELDYLNAEAVIIEADFSESDIRIDGMPRSNARQPEFPGVRISFDTSMGRLAYQTDTCDNWQHNVRSIALGLEALRAVDRYGITSRSEQYAGFKALPAGPTPTFATVEDALTWLTSEEATGIRGADGLTPKAAYRMASRRHHPDAGGQPKLWDKVNAAHQMLTKAGWL